MRRGRSTFVKGVKSISRIIALASTMKETEPVLSRRYVVLSEKIAKRLDVTLPPNIKRSYCKACKTMYGPSTRIRLSHGMLTVTCHNCSDVRRIPVR